MADDQGPCENDDCDKCHPMPRWTISEHRIQHITYEREIKAPTLEDAMRIFEQGTAWPASYDDRYGTIVQRDPVKVEQVANEQRLQYFREDVCYHDLPRALEEAGVGGFEDLGETKPVEKSHEDVPG